MKKIINVLLIIYVCITIPVTILLINYNDYNITEIGNKTFIVPDNDLLKDFSKTKFLVLKNNTSNLKVGDKVFYYDTYYSPVNVKYEKISDIDNENGTYVVGSESKYILEKDIITNQENTKIYPFIGIFVSTLTSKWGYLLLIILPILVLFGMEVYLLTKEIKKVNRYEKK